MSEAEWARLLEAQRLLQSHFPELVLVGGTAALESLAGWQTSRLRPPVMILGRFQGIDTGIRQLIRTEPLETVVIQGIRVPTLQEMARIKAWLVVTRNATRDYVDLCALCYRLAEGATDALRPLDRLYPQQSGETVTRQLCKQLAEPKPYDRTSVDLSKYRGIQAPWNSWEAVEEFCRKLSDRIAVDILGLDP